MSNDIRGLHSRRCYEGKWGLRQGSDIGEEQLTSQTHLQIGLQLLFSLDLLVDLQFDLPVNIVSKLR